MNPQELQDQPPCILPFPGRPQAAPGVVQPRVTVCIGTEGDNRLSLQRCLEHLLAATPPEQIELRLGFDRAPISFAYALGRLGPQRGCPERVLLPGGVERLRWQASWGLNILLWQSAVALGKQPLARLLFHDVPLSTEYVVWLADETFLEPGWWPALVPLLDAQAGYIGQPRWAYYLPEEMKRIQAQPWYRGIPFAQRKGRPGVSFMSRGLLAIQTVRLQEVGFPDVTSLGKGEGLCQDGERLLGEIAHQLGWTQAPYKHIRSDPPSVGSPSDLHPSSLRPPLGPQSKKGPARTSEPRAWQWTLSVPGFPANLRLRRSQPGALGFRLCAGRAQALLSVLASTGCRVAETLAPRAIGTKWAARAAWCSLGLIPSLQSPSFSA